MFILLYLLLCYPDVGDDYLHDGGSNNTILFEKKILLFFSLLMLLDSK